MLASERTVPPIPTRTSPRPAAGSAPASRLRTSWRNAWSSRDRGRLARRNVLVVLTAPRGRLAIDTELGLVLRAENLHVDALLAAERSEKLLGIARVPHGRRRHRDDPRTPGV